MGLPMATSAIRWLCARPGRPVRCRVRCGGIRFWCRGAHRWFGLVLGNNTMCVRCAYVCTGLAFPRGSMRHPFSPVRVWPDWRDSVAAGKAMHALALRSDGTVWSWGTEHYGYPRQQGTATLQRSLACPVPTVSGAVLSGVASITAEMNIPWRAARWQRSRGETTPTASSASVSPDHQPSSMRAVKVMAGGRCADWGRRRSNTKDATLFLKADGSVWGRGSRTISGRSAMRPAARMSIRCGY